jgi:hypothetical protein
MSIVDSNLTDSLDRAEVSVSVFTGGTITDIELNETTWTALPTAPLANRKSIAIQNHSNRSVKLNFSDAVVGYVGIELRAGAERQYDITDSIVLYGKSINGTPTVTIEEIA